jgi:nucleotidyltransferase substrate binding protein (TIGR01987 family)
MIDTSSLTKALQTLEVALAALARTPEDNFIRDACIKRFEYSYELSHKLLRRYLEATEPDGVNDLSFPKLIRLGYERALLSESWDVWEGFRDARNTTSHAYNEKKARDVLEKIPAFLKAARFLGGQIEARQT